MNIFLEAKRNRLSKIIKYGSEWRNTKGPKERSQTLVGSEVDFVSKKLYFVDVSKFPVTRRDE